MPGFKTEIPKVFSEQWDSLRSRSFDLAVNFHEFLFGKIGHSPR